jgi:hypothetical protein
MTTEEFHGHLMVALQGPHGPAIARRVMALAMTDRETAGAMGVFLEAVISDIESDVLNLQLCMQVQDAIKHPPRHVNVMKWTIDKVDASKVIMDKLRASLRAKMEGVPMGRELAERIGLSLESTP